MPPNRNWMEQLLIDWGPRCPDSEKACWSSSDCPSEYYYCTFQESGVITPTTMPGCCTLPEEQEIDPNEQTFCMEDRDCRPGFICVSMPNSPVEYNECVPGGVTPPPRDGGMGKKILHGIKKNNIKKNNIKKKKPQIKKLYEKTKHIDESPTKEPKQFYVRYTTRLTQQELEKEKQSKNLTFIKNVTKSDKIIKSAATIAIVVGGSKSQFRKDSRVKEIFNLPKHTLDECTGYCQGDGTGPSPMVCGNENQSPNTWIYCNGLGPTSCDSCVDNDYQGCSWVDTSPCTDGCTSFCDGNTSHHSGQCGANGCDCEYETTDCLYGCNQTSGNCNPAPGYDGPTDQPVDPCPEGYDECGICGGPGPTYGDGCCASELDECGVCHGAGADVGCDGVCFSGLVLDECEICDGPGAIYECGCFDSEVGYNCNGDYDVITNPLNNIYVTPYSHIIYNHANQIDHCPSWDEYFNLLSHSVNYLQQNMKWGTCFGDAITEFGLGSHSPTIGQWEWGWQYLEHPSISPGKVSIANDCSVPQSMMKKEHGLGVASIMIADSDGMTGTCPNCNLDFMVYGTGADGTLDLFGMLEYAVENDLRVVNLSLGTYSSDLSTSFMAPYCNAITEAYNQGTLLVVSAGNDYLDTNSPSFGKLYVSCNDVLAVADASHHFNYDNSCTGDTSSGSCDNLDVSSPNGYNAVTAAPQMESEAGWSQYYSQCIPRNCNSAFYLGDTGTIPEWWQFYSQQLWGNDIYHPSYSTACSSWWYQLGKAPDGYPVGQAYSGLTCTEDENGAPALQHCRDYMCEEEGCYYNHNVDECNADFRCKQQTEYDRLGCLTATGDNQIFYDANTEDGGILSQCKYRICSGTSFSAPTVAGIAGLLLSHNPNLTGPQIKEILTATNDLPSTRTTDGITACPTVAVHNQWYEGMMVRRPGAVNAHAALAYMYANYL